MKIGLDTNIFIYALNDNIEFGQPATQLILSVVNGVNQAVASTVLLMEIMYKGGEQAVRVIESTKNLHILPVDREVAMATAKLMAAHGRGLKPIDAIHLATAQVSGAAVFWTNDKALNKIHVPGLRIKILE